MKPLPKRFKRETPYDKLNMDEIAEILGMDRAGVLSVIFKGKLRVTKHNGKRVARRADVMTCKAKLEAEAAGSPQR